jgi:hypothetical protein
MLRKRLLYIITTFIMAFSFPLSAFADSTDPAAGDSTDSSSATANPAPAADSTTPAASPVPAPAAAVNPGPSSPTGADANTYTYNSTTGLWENQYYTWNPITHQTQPKSAPSYSYNPSTGMWDTTQWVYDAPTGKYVPNISSAAAAPVSALSNIPASVGTNTSGPSSVNSVNTNTKNSGVFDLFYNAQISNNITQNANSGSAAVIGNTVGGSALSGNALDVTNIVNMLSSSFGLQNAANLMTFTENINGDVVGDLYIDPNQINNQSVTLNNSNAQNNVTINANGSGLINNDITLGATSGNATVADNTHAGDATTGNANAIANVVNMINSAVAANQSFLGVININGNLDGDILLPPNFLDQLVASNAPHATVDINSVTHNNLTANINNTENIANNVTLSAASGAALVDSNTNAGSATTGSANTNLTIFNLTGKQVIAKDSILVFVNVLGQWVGLIMNAPTGTTAAMVGGNVTTNNNTNNNATINENSTNTIVNNIKEMAKSGDAAVTDNTTAGNAKSGNATASANIANFIDSQFSASDWFGLLFINVLGSWHGSFGVNTAAGTIFNQRNEAALGLGSGGGSQIPAKAAVFSFVAKKTTSSASHSGNTASSSNANDNNPKVVLASSTNRPSGGPKVAAAESAAPTETIASNSKTWVLPVVSFAAVMGITSAIGYSGGLTDKLYARMLSIRLGKN